MQTACIVLTGIFENAEALFVLNSWPSNFHGYWFNFIPCCFYLAGIT
jgi:hypothetical protein